MSTDNTSLRLLRKVDMPDDTAFSDVGAYATPSGRFAELAKVITSTDNVVSMRPIPAENLGWYLAKLDRAEDRLRGKRSG